jgi:hypothetical protein
MEEHRQRKNTVEPRREEVTGDWRKLLCGEIHDLYCSPNITRLVEAGRIRLAGHVACVGKKRNAYRI